MEIYELIQKACLPGIWSKGIALAREKSVIADSRRPDELVFRIKMASRPVAPKVTLWPEDADYYCDCGEKVEPCAHIAAAVVALKQGLVVDGTQPGGAAPARVSYRLRREQGELRFERWLGEELLSGSLVARVGGLESGRLHGQLVAASQEDFAVDRALGPGGVSGRLARASWARLLDALRGIEGVTLDGAPIRIGLPFQPLQAEVIEEGPGFRLRASQAAEVIEIFEPGIALHGSVLSLLENPGLTPEERALLGGQGQWFAPSEVRRLVTEILPALERKVPLEIKSKRLPSASRSKPRIVIDCDAPGRETLELIPRIAYEGELAIPDSAEERKLARELQSELHLSLGARARFMGQDAIEMLERIRSYELTGSGADAFKLHGSLDPSLTLTDTGGLTIHFATASDSGTPRMADPQAVFRAWRSGAQFVPLLDGGWARLPGDWLARYGARIEELLQARDIRGTVARARFPELIELAAELELELPDPLREFHERLERVERIPDYGLPRDLRAELRPYQKVGHRWLRFLGQNGMGALLADDMGLGKTLQALCAVQGRTLVVCPASVLRGWEEQIRTFRPALKTSIYHGPTRKLDPEGDVTLTTYAVLRLDRETLCAREWDSAILDEAQTIKNPESQVSQAAHALRARTRMALSGTPVENRLEDLWSQFQFLNPGLLGSRSRFLERYGEQAIPRLRARIRPFVLRRLKREVAPELPPRTETVLYCDLSDSERELYEALLASGRKEVLERLEAGASVFSALEILLRLRQACCHPALVPGHDAPGSRAQNSSKVDLLVETLEESVAIGHRALVFSQWTSLLDLIEPSLRDKAIPFLRLDGATPTQDRQDVVRRFQNAQAPVLLMSLKAGGVGLTLTAADQVFLMDPWWNPAAEDQAADRAHRIGQQNPVIIHRLVAERTIEERILELQKRKRALAQAALEGAEATAALTREDLLELLR